MAKITFLTFYDPICMGIRYLSSALKHAGHEVRLIFFKRNYGAPVERDDQGIMYTMYHNGELTGCAFDINPPTAHEIELLRKRIADTKPDILGVSTRSFWLEMGHDLLDILARDNPNTITIAGGYGPSLSPGEFASFTDYICVGEGDRMMVDAAAAVDAGNPEAIRSLPNAGYLDEHGDLVVNPPRKPIADLETVFYPDWSDQEHDLIEDDQLIEGGEKFRKLSWYDIYVGRGCYGSCSYCMAGQWQRVYKEAGGIDFPRFRKRSPGHVIEEILEAMDAHDLEKVRFMDSIFPADNKWVTEFCRRYSDEVRLPFYCNIEPRFHSIEMLEMLYEAGLRQTVLGLQSGSERIREEVFHRKVSNEKVIEAARWLEARAVEHHQDLLSFNPFDTEETLNETFQFLCDLPPCRDLYVYRLKFFPMSPLGRLVAEKKPKGLSDDHHRAWIFLWILAGQGGEDREWAMALRDAYGGRTPLDRLQTLRERFEALKKPALSCR